MCIVVALTWAIWSKGFRVQILNVCQELQCLSSEGPGSVVARQCSGSVVAVPKRLLFTDTGQGTSGSRPACPPTQYPGGVFWHTKAQNVTHSHTKGSQKFLGPSPLGGWPSAKRKPGAKHTSIREMCGKIISITPKEKSTMHCVGKKGAHATWL